MGANAQTTVPTFTAGAVLTAAQMNQSARTGVPVFADTTARDAAFGGTGEKTLAEGQLAYIEANDIVQYYDGSTWRTLGPSSPGLSLVTPKTTFTTVATVTLAASTFTSTYSNYRILFRVTAASGNASLTWRLRAGSTDLATNYYYGTLGLQSTGGAANFNADNGTAVQLGYAAAANPMTSFAIELYSPQLAEQTVMTYFGFSYSSNYANAQSVMGANFTPNTTSYDACTFLSSANITGHYTVYGYNQ